MKITLALLVAAVVAAPAFGGSSHSGTDGFSAKVDNPWFPLKPGTTFVYRGVKDGKSGRDVMTATRKTTVIDGAPCVLVDDRTYLDGYLAERTTDWYSQDRAGNVWYFGENTAELDRNGKVMTREGTWRAGRDGAKAGIYMPAHPKVGQTGLQEYYKGQAEDHFKVLDLHAHVSVPFRTAGDALLTQEWTPLEPGVLDHKLYLRGVGTVEEKTVKGGDEHFSLVSVQHA